MAQFVIIRLEQIARKKHFFDANFTYLGKEIVISVSISDRCEDRERFKPTVAADTATYFLRKLGLFTGRCLHAKDMIEVKRKETVPYNDTKMAIKQAEEDFKASPMTMNKLVIAMSNANGCTV